MDQMNPFEEKRKLTPTSNRGFVLLSGVAAVLFLLFLGVISG